MPASSAIFAIGSRSLITPPGLARLSMKKAFVLGVSARLKLSGVVGVDDVRLPAELGIGVAHLLQRAAVKARRGDDVVARAHQREQREHLRRMARGRHCTAAAAFEGGETRFQRSGGRVRQPRIDEAHGLQVEQRRGVVGVFEHIGRRPDIWAVPSHRWWDRVLRRHGSRESRSRSSCRSWRYSAAEDDAGWAADAQPEGSR